MRLIKTAPFDNHALPPHENIIAIRDLLVMFLSRLRPGPDPLGTLLPEHLQGRASEPSQPSGHHSPLAFLCAPAALQRRANAVEQTVVRFSARESERGARACVVRVQ